MRCKTCDYPLWNLKARQCPECAAPFRPSDFDFAPGTVRFGCPHCGVQYVGTDHRGHPTPAVFPCASCGTRIHIDEMVLIPAAGNVDEQTKVHRMPWLERSERGLIKGWFATIGWAMVRPNRLIRAVPENSSAGAAWLYAVLTTIGFCTIGIVAPQIVTGVLGRGGLPVGLWGGSAIMLAGLAVGCALFVLLWVLTAHGILKITGGRVRPLARTYQCICYGAGAGAPAAVPCCGAWIGLVWWIVSAANMLKEGHRVHGGRAALAALAFPAALMLAAPFAWIAWVTGMMMAGGGMFGRGVAWTPQNASLSTLNASLLQYSFQNSGAGPQHSIEMTLFGNMTAVWGAPGANAPFCQPGSKTTASVIPVNAGTFQSFQALPRSQQLGEVQMVLAAMPPNVVAHRFGDFVFTYHGATLNSMDANLWVIVMLPDPAVNGAPAPGDTVLIGSADYTVTSTTFGQLPTLVQQQNRHRATLGLPPLPDLSTVTHGNPAVQAAPSPPDGAAVPE